ncbi:MAG: hypothetical protein EHM70_19130 [Chloroflexota bacterium]|nr:MAG: hypothetical protein EHM70_19130 [Chloroflexota bacterium]
MTIERISSRPITSTLHKAFSLWVLFTLILSGCGKFPPAGQPGVMFRLDPEHSGVYTISAQASPVEWKFKTEAAVYSSPVISGDVLFAASFDGKLYAIDPITGKKVWQYDSQAGIYSSPVVYEGVVYFGNANGVIFAVDIESRQQKWQYQTQGPVHSSPAVANGNVYAGSGDGHLYALDAKTGEEKWIFKPGGPVFSSPTVDQGVVYFGSGDGYVYALDAKTGEEKWAYQAKDWIFSSPALSGNLLFFGSHDKNLYAIDVTSHELKWSFETGGIIESSPTISDGTVYFGSSDGYLYALDAATGNEKWRFSTQSEVYSSPAVLDGAVYFGSFNGRFYAVDAANGTELWNIRTDGRVYSSPALTNDMAYYGSEDGNFYAVSRRGPQSANLFPAPTPLPFQVTPEGSTALPPLQPAGYSWWNDQVFYEVFIRSFRDASGDGAGDIQGLIDKLDYLNDGDPATNQDLGITALLLLPVSEAASPHGYDAIDFEQVEQDFGSNADFQRLVSEAHRRGIKIVLELALNQTSNQHPWFVDSQTPGSEHDHWYVWSNGNPGYTGPQGELLWFPAGSRYYYAHFAEAMPDLNLRNPAVTGALYDVARFWLEDM